MKRNRWAAWLLILMMVAGIPSAAQAMYNPNGSPATRIHLNEVVKPPIHINPPVGVATPKPNSLPQPRPQPEAAALRVTVDKTEATVGETLHFSASMTGGRGKKSITLWIFKDGKRIAILFDNARKKWNYTPDAPGVYHGEASGTDSTGSLYRSTKKVTVTGGATQLMNLQPPLWIPPVLDFSWLEDTRFEDVAIEVMADKNIKNIKYDILLADDVLIWSPNHRRGRGHPSTLGYVQCPKRPPRHESAAKASYKGEDVLVSYMPENDVWKGGRLAVNYPVSVTVSADGPDGALVRQMSFNIRYLRDANRNGIADLYEQDGGLKLTGISDRTVLDGLKIKPIGFRVLEAPEVQWPVEYGLSNAPNGLNLRGEMQGGNPLSKPEVDIVGAARLKWASNETSRTVRVTYKARDKSGQGAQAAFNMHVLRDDNGDNVPDDVLSIERVPARYVIEGQPLPPIPIFVRSSLKEPITMEVCQWVFIPSFDEDKYVCEYVQSGEYGLKLTPDPVSHTALDPDVSLYKYTLSGNFRMFKKDGWHDGEYERFMYFKVYATAGGLFAREDFLVKVLRKSGHRAAAYQFLPIPDVTVNEEDWHDTIHATLGLTEQGVKIHATGLPEGVVFERKQDASGGDIGEDIYGSPSISDWLPGETHRRVSINLYAVYKGEKGKQYGFEDDKTFAHAQFYMDIIRQPSLYAPFINDIPDIRVRSREPMQPHLVTVGPDGYRLSSLCLMGHPVGIRFGPGHLIEGTPTIQDWEDNEFERSFPISVVGQLMPPPTTDRHDNMVLQSAQECTTSFTLTVYRQVLRPIESVLSGQDALLNAGHLQAGNALNTDPAAPAPQAEDAPPAAPPEKAPDTENAPDTAPEKAPETPPTAPPDAEYVAPLDPAKTYHEGDEATAEETATLPGMPPIVKNSVIVIAQSDDSRAQEESRAGILNGLFQVGYRVGKSIKVEYMNANGDAAKAEKIAAGLAQKKCSLIVAIGEPMAQALHKALNGRVPLIYSNVENPVQAGLSDEKGMSIGPVTGFSSAAPLVHLLTSVSLMQPNASKIALLYQAGDSRIDSFLETAEAMGLSVSHAAISDPAVLLQEAEKLLPDSDLMLLGFDPQNDEVTTALMAAAQKAGKPVYTLFRTQLAQGAAVAGITDARQQGSDAGIVAARILAGEDAAAIPFALPDSTQTIYQNEVIEAFGIPPQDNARSWFE